MKNLINQWMLRSLMVAFLVVLGTAFNSKAGGSIATPTNVTISGGGSYCSTASTTPLTTAITWAICSGSGGTTNAPIATYSWYSNTVNSNSGGTLVATTATYNAPISTVGTLYYYCVITWNDPDGVSTCSAGSFTSSTGTVTVTPGPCYCAAPAGNCAVGDYISNVSFGTINTSSGCLNGTNNTSCVSLPLGSTTNISISVGPGTGNHYLATYIDWNGDGDFTDAGEFTLLSGSVAPNSTVNSSITVPGTATCGATIRFRIRYSYSTALTASTSCSGGGTYGETQDYCITVTCSLPTCDDGIMNQDETGVDCGGATCPPCVDACHDGIQNSDETGVDCGGAFCLPCTTNGSLTPTTSCCSNTSQASVYPTVCPQVGTSAYDLNSPIVEFTSQNTSGCTPSGTPTGCGTYSTLGSWAHISLEDGVDQLQMSWAQGAGDGIASGNSTIYGAMFQGASCASLSYLSCQPLVDFSASGYYVYQAQFTGLDPNQDVWIYTWNNNGKTYNMDFQFIGVNQSPSNTSCATAAAALDQGCNLGATGATFTTPGAAGYACSGGNWGSNENTTFYSFTADDVTGSLEIDNITCNNGESGNAQFAVWTSCAGVGSYGAGSGFLGCAVGTATISLSPLTPGQTYYIATDGFAGDNCIFGFTGTGIILPIQFWYLDAAYEGKVVNVNWGSLSESNCSHYIIQRTQDGRSYTDLGTVSGNGKTKEANEYMFVDYTPLVGTSYYRLKQVDYDGNYKYSEIRVVKSAKDNAVVLRTYNLMGQEVGPEFKGVVIDYYSDGTAIKRIQE